MTRRIVLSVVLSLLCTAALAQQTIPSPAEFLGYPIGERFTPHHRILDVLRRAREALEPHHRAHDRRDLRRPAARPGHDHLGEEPRAPRRRSARNVATLARGEGDAAALTKIDAGDRLARVRRPRQRVVVRRGVDDGRARAADAIPSSRGCSTTWSCSSIRSRIPTAASATCSGSTARAASAPNPNPDAFEHQEPWPGGRFNHYLIDMNRDWAWQSQRETQARVAAYREWNPQVFVDFHEMFFNSTYFFPPDAKPINANLPEGRRGLAGRLRPRERRRVLAARLAVLRRPSASISSIPATATPGRRCTARSG